MRRKTLLLLPFLFIWAAACLAQNPHPAWRNYNTDHGLPSQEVHCILQDREGYMWFGTDNGVSRFDGYTFQNFGPREGLQDVVVFEMLEDRRGRIWMNTMSGNIYYFEKDSIYAYRYNDTIQRYRSRYTVATRLYVDSAGTVLTCLQNLGILKITQSGEHRLFQCRNQCEGIAMTFDGFNLVSDRAYPAMSHSLRDSLNHALDLRKKWAPIEFLTDEGWIQTKEFEHFGSTGNGRIFHLGEHRFLLFKSYGIYFIDLFKVIWQRPESTEFIFSMQEGDSDIWIGLNDGRGLRKYASTRALKDNSYEQYLEGYSVSRVYQDRQGGYWIATLENGVYYTPGFSMLIYDEKAGLSTSFVSSVELNGQGEVFTGMRNGELFKISPSVKGLEKLPSKSDGSPVYDLYHHGEDGTLWIGGVELKYYRLGETNLLTFRNERLKKTGWVTAKKFHPLPQNQRLWAAGHKGLAFIDLEDKAFQVVSEVAYGTELFDSRVFAVHEDFSGKVWLGMENGLYDWNGGRPEPVTVEHPAFRVRVEDLAQLADSTLVIGTKGQGIAFWKGGSIRQFTTNEGLTADMIENVHVDERGQIWVGTLNGLNKFYQKDGNWVIEQMTTAHGLPSNAISMVKTAGDDVWVATDRGLVHFRDERQVNTYAPLPKITSVLAGRRPVDLHAPARLGFWENNVSIRFATLNHRLNGKVPYRFRVDGEAWTNTKNTSVNFPSLPSGNRLFEVQSQNEDGIWSESATFGFYIAPPWWRTWWAISLELLLAGIAVVVFYKYRTNQLKREIALQKQLGEVERQALRSQMNPHFIFNSLNAIQGYIGQGDKLAANRYLSRFAKLIRSALQHSRMTQVPLEDDIAALQNYLELEQMRFEGKFDFAIHVPPDIATTEITLPPLLVQPFVENAIVHGLASKDGKGQIDIDYQLENGSLRITVTDNGIGIEESKKRKAGVASSHKSIGLSVTKRRLDMLAGNGETGRVDIEELKNGQGEVEGTRASIWVPLEVE